VREVIRILEDSGIDYVIVGGLAAIYYGEPRATQDIDIIIRPRSEEYIEKLCDLFTSRGFIIIGGCLAVKRSMTERIHTTIYDKNYLFRVDLQGIYNRLNFLAFEGRRRVKIFGLDAWIQGPEDLIVAKLTYYVGNRDIRDIIAILRNSKDLIDWERLIRIAQEFSVEPQLREIIKHLNSE